MPGSKVFIHQGTKCVPGHRAIPYHGVIVKANGDGTFQIKNCGAATRQTIRTEHGYHIFAAPTSLDVPSSRDLPLAMKRLINENNKNECN